MRKPILIALSLLLFATAAACTSSDSPNTSAIGQLQESPKTYVLKGDEFMLMPTVTLYQDGTARLSQPPISSYSIHDLGHYQVQGNQLTVSYDNGISAAFRVTSGGDTLTLIRSTLGCTKKGSAYHYRPQADHLKAKSKIDGNVLTLETLRELAPKASELTLADFATYTHIELDPDQYLLDIEGIYTLRIVRPSRGDTYIELERKASGERFPFSLNGSTGLVLDEFLGLSTVPHYKARPWLDYYQDEALPWNDRIDLTLPEFPGVTFAWTSEKVTANGQELFSGMPVWNVFLADLTNDGKPEFCATISLGSGIIDDRIIVYDYAAGRSYQLAARMKYDFQLTFEHDEIRLIQREYGRSNPIVTTGLRLINGAIDAPGLNHPNS